MNLKGDGHWFRFYRLFELPKPLCWMGWVCYAAQMLFVFLLGLVFGHYNLFGKYSLFVLAGLIWLSIIVFITIAIFKSNFMELSASLKQM